MLNPFKPKRRANVPSEDQLSVLAQAGITLDPRVRPEALLLSCTRQQIEQDPYRLLLGILGNDAEVESQKGISGGPSQDIWHFDTECIENHGSYVRIALRLAHLAKGALPVEAVEDFVDLEEGTAWLAFKLYGQSHRWKAGASPTST